MISPLRIAVQGLVPGGAPLEIASQGLIVTITPAPEPEEEDNFFVPVFFRPPPKDRKSVRIEVQGVTAHLTATTANVAAGMPTTEELDAEDDFAWVEHTRRMEAEAAEDREEEIRFLVWEYFQERDARLQKIEIERRLFNEGLTKFRADLKDPTDDHANLTALCFAMSSKVGELRRQIRGMKEAVEKSKPRAKKSR